MTGEIIAGHRVRVQEDQLEVICSDTHTFTKLHLPEDIKSLATTDCLLVNSSLFVGSTIGGTSPSKLILFNLDGV